jgi:hypothetical protein
MAEQSFTVFKGIFPCKECKEDVLSLRFWSDSGSATWMCSKKHISKVSLVPKKKKKADFTNE